jgi:hypothetical protein
MLQFFFDLSFRFIPYLFCGRFFILSSLLLQFVHFLVQNACVVLGLLQIISPPVLLSCHSCLFLMSPYKCFLNFLSCTARAYFATNKFQLGFVIPICFVNAPYQMLPLALKFVYYCALQQQNSNYFKILYIIAH